MAAHALAAMARVIGGVGTALEVIDRKTYAHHEFFSSGLAPAGQLQYVEDYFALKPRFLPALRQRPAGHRRRRHPAKSATPR